MRLNTNVQVNKYITATSDGYGGLIEGSRSYFNVMAIVSIASNDLKPQSSGLGFYRVITLIVESGELEIGNRVIFNNVEYEVTSSIPYKSQLHECYKGYEV